MLKLFPLRPTQQAGVVKSFQLLLEDNQAGHLHSQTTHRKEKHKNKGKIPNLLLVYFSGHL
jgi:hypothetical protein